MATVTVRSDKDPEVAYAVDVTAGTCTCPQYVQRLKLMNDSDGGTRTCKHVDRLRADPPETP